MGSFKPLAQLCPTFFSTFVAEFKVLIPCWGQESALAATLTLQLLSMLIPPLEQQCLPWVEAKERTPAQGCKLIDSYASATKSLYPLVGTGGIDSILTQQTTALYHIRYDKHFKALVHWVANNKTGNLLLCESCSLGVIFSSPPPPVFSLPLPPYYFVSYVLMMNALDWTCDPCSGCCQLCHSIPL